MWKPLLYLQFRNGQFRFSLDCKCMMIIKLGKNANQVMLFPAFYGTGHGLTAELVHNQYEKAKSLLNANRKKLDELSRNLYDKGTNFGEEHMRILNV